MEVANKAATLSQKSRLSESEVAFCLLVELLAHQFAYPVRWIETQDVLLSKDARVSRFIELGPGAILTGMARKTQKAKYQTIDKLLSLQRDFLFCGSDAKAIRYEYEAKIEVEEAPVEDVPPPMSRREKRMSVVDTMVYAKPSEPAATVAASSIADVPVPALQMLLALIAFKLRKPLESIQTSQSLKDLSAGKSTLQNELLGDIGTQFPSTPDGAEDMPLAALAEGLEPSNTGQPSLALSETIGRWISAIMPPKCNLNTLRDYLKNSWGLGPSRAMSVVLFALTQTIADGAPRLSSLNAAKELFDSATQRYAAFTGLTLQKASGSAAQAASNTPVLDPEALERITRDQRVLAKVQYQALARYLGIDDTNEVKMAELEAMCESQTERLTLWATEFGLDFESGIKGRFNPKHLRHFNFWWSQARLDICGLYHNSTLRQVLHHGGALQNEHLWHIANRAGPRTLSLVADLIAQKALSNEFSTVGQSLVSLIRSSLASDGPKAKFPSQTFAPKTVIDIDGSIKYQEIPRTASGSPSSYADILHRKGRAALRTQHSGQWMINSDMTTRLMNTITRALNDGLSFTGKTVLVIGAGAGSIGAELIKKLLAGGATVIATTSRDISAAQTLYRQIYRDCAGRGAEMFVLPFNQASVKDCEDLVSYIYSETGLARDIDVLIPFAAMPEGGAEIDQLGPKSELAHRLMLTNVIRLIGYIVQEKTEQDISFRPTQVLLPLSPNHGSFGGDGLYSESKLGLESLLCRFASESWKDKISICGVSIGWTRGTGLMESNDQLAEAVELNEVLTFSQEEMALNILALLSPDIAEFCEDEAVFADFGGGLGRLQNLKQVITQARNSIKETQQSQKAINEEDALEKAMVKPQSKASSKDKPVQPTTRLTTLDINFPTLPSYDRDLKDLHQDLRGMVDLGSTVVIVGFSELGPWGNARTRWQMESKRKLAQAGYIELAWMMGLIKHFDGEHKAGGHYVGWVDSDSGEQVADDAVAERYSKHIISHAGIRLIEPSAAGGYDPQQREFLQELAVEEDLPEFDTTMATADGLKKKYGEHLTIRKVPDSETVKVQIKAGASIKVSKIVPLAASVVAGLLPTGWNASRYGIPDDIIGQVDAVTLYSLCCVAEAFLSAGIEQPQEIFKYIHFSELGNFIGTALGPTNKSREMFHDIRMNKQVQGDIYAEMNMNTPAAWVNMLLLGANGPIKTPVGACASGLESMDIGVESIVSGKTSMCIVGAVDNFQEDESQAFSTIKATVDATKQFAEGRQPSEFSRPTAETRAGFLESAGCGVQLVCTAELALRMGLPIYAVVAGSSMAADKISRSVPAPGKGLLTFARESEGAADSPLLDIRYRKAQMQKALARADPRSHEGSPSNDSRAGSFDSTPPSSVSGADLRARNDSDGSYSMISKASIKWQGEHDDTSVGSPSYASYAVEAQNIRRQWGNEFRKQDPRISPMRASLAVFGLTVDDICMVSLHGTSTKANDTNEPETVNQQMTHLGRKGSPLFAIAQKSITGHPKGPAASWMLNGCLQAMHERLIPGNYNCDNIDAGLEKFTHIIFPTESMPVDEVRAFLLDSFGFGQKGAQMIGVNPRYLFATLDSHIYEEYARSCATRKRLGNRAFATALTTNSIVKVRANPPYEKEEMAQVLLDPLARLRARSTTAEMFYDPKLAHGDLSLQTSSFHSSPFADIPIEATHEDISETTAETHRTVAMLLSSIPPNAAVRAIGVDIENISAFKSDDNPTFLSRNFRAEEIAAARASRDTHSTFVSRWCAKEAVFKSLNVKSKGAGAPLQDIEIWSDGNGVPKVRLHGQALETANSAGVTAVLLSISYGEDNAIAVAVSQC